MQRVGVGKLVVHDFEITLTNIFSYVDHWVLVNQKRVMSRNNLLVLLSRILMNWWLSFFRFLGCRVIQKVYCILFLVVAEGRL